MRSLTNHFALLNGAVTQWHTNTPFRKFWDHRHVYGTTIARHIILARKSRASSYTSHFQQFSRNRVDHIFWHISLHQIQVVLTCRLYLGKGDLSSFLTAAFDKRSTDVSYISFRPWDANSAGAATVRPMSHMRLYSAIFFAQSHRATKSRMQLRTLQLQQIAWTNVASTWLLQTSSQNSFIYPPRLVHFPTQRHQRRRLEHAWICALYKFCNNINNNNTDSDYDILASSLALVSSVVNQKRRRKASQRTQTNKNVETVSQFAHSVCDGGA